MREAKKHWLLVELRVKMLPKQEAFWVKNGQISPKSKEADLNFLTSLDHC